VSDKTGCVLYTYIIGVNICRLKEIGPDEKSGWLFAICRVLVDKFKNRRELALGKKEGSYSPDVVLGNIVDFVFNGCHNPKVMTSTAQCPVPRKVSVIWRKPSGFRIRNLFTIYRLVKSSKFDVLTSGVCCG